MRFQAQYSISQGSGTFKKDAKTGRLVFVRKLGSIVKLALKYGSKHVGEKVPLQDLINHIATHSKGSNYRDVYYIVNTWLVNGLGVATMKGDPLVVVFSKKTPEVLSKFTGK